MSIFSRKKFFAASAFLILPKFISAGPFIKKKKLIVHHVLFWLRKPISNDEKNKFINDLKSLIEIEHHHTFIGEPISNQEIKEESTYDVSLLTYFDDVQGYQAYKDHNVYKNLIKKYSSSWDKVVEYNSLTL